MAQATQNFSVFNPTENEPFALDFVNDLRAGDFPTAIVSVTLSDPSGTDPAPQSRCVGSPVLSGTKVIQRCGNNAISGVNYKMSAVITTNLGDTLDLFTYLPCEDG